MKAFVRINQGSPFAGRAGRWLRGSLLGIASLFAIHGSLAADGPIAAVQNALIREKFLTGEPSGVLDDTTRGALRKFQAYRSLPATGEMDTATLQALESNPQAQVHPAKPAEAPLPKEVVKDDREFLDKLASGAEPLPRTPEPSKANLPPIKANPSPLAVEAVGERLIPRKEPESPASPKPVKAEIAIQNPESEMTRPKSKPHAMRPEPVAPRKKEPVVQASVPASGANREAESGQPPRAIQIRPAVRANANSEIEEASNTSGVKVVRTRTTTTGPDGRTHVSETTTTTTPSTTPPLAARKPVEVRSPSKRTGLFDRIFRDHGDRDEDDD